ncbi:MAG: 4-hydroxybenzoate octaprenyltransferase [Planctomycetota bacterium]
MSQATVSSPPASRGLLRAVAVAAADIKLAHTVFAMPFALLGAFMALPADLGWGPTAAKLALVVVCMVAARTWAMLFNRLADHRLDADNPRTTARAIASGRLSIAQGWGLAIASAALFVAAAAAFWPLFDNPWPARLALPVLLWIALYSLTKRVTALCHLVLGSALALSPLSAAIALDPTAVGLAANTTTALVSTPTTPALFAIAAMVLVWVAGFDVIYALQDMDHDRRVGLHSLPAALGQRRAIWVSRALHAIAIGALATAGALEPRFGPIYAAAVALVAALLLAEHAILARRGRDGLQAAFFTVNGIVSLVFSALATLDLLA